MRLFLYLLILTFTLFTQKVTEKIAGNTIQLSFNSIYLKNEFIAIPNTSYEINEIENVKIEYAFKRKK